MSQSTGASAAPALNTPEALHALYEKYVNQGDLDQLMVLYASQPTLVNRDGQLISGQAALREFIGGLLSLKPQMTVKTRQTINAGEIAVVISDWQMTGSTPDGASFSDGGCTYDIMLRQADGSWRLVVDNPWTTSPANS